MSAVRSAVAVIAREREKIWLDVPSEIENLKTMRKGRGGNFAIRIYAFSDLYRNQRNLWLLRNLIKDGKLSPQSAGALVIPFLEEMADRFALWKLETSSRMFTVAKDALDSVEYDHEFLNLLDELLIYNNRLWLWLDGCIPWFDLDAKL